MKLKPIKIDLRLIPEWNENRKLPTAEQVVIHFHRIPGTSEKSNYKNFKSDQSGAISLSYNDNMLCSGFIKKIENLEVEKAIKNGQDLATATHPLFEDLISEIREYLFPDGEDFSEGE